MTCSEDSEAEQQISTDTYSFRPIGHVVVETVDPTSGDGKRDESTIVLDPALADGLSDLHADQRLLVVFVFHLAEGYELKQHPRGDRNRAKKGVFALRFPHRPNPIGLTEVKLLAIQGHVLRIEGLDAWDGTPVLDLKPI